MIALLREVSPQLNACELTYQVRGAIDARRARRQHDTYAATLRDLGARLEYLEPAPELPDGVFVEDTAVVLSEIAVLGRPGVTSRQPEIETARAALSRHRAVRGISEPGHLEGGDVLRIGRRLYVGRSGRTNAAGVAALARLMAEFGYEVVPVPTSECLHLKTACTFIPPHLLLLNPAWVAPDSFAGLTLVAVDPTEPGAANSLTIGGTTLLSATFPKTTQRLRAAGVVTQSLDISELEKAEAGLTCLSLILEE